MPFDTDAPSTAADTRDRLLDAAEELFAEHGFASASLRQITERAAANIAAVNYHFGSKEALLQAVFLRRIRPMNVERFHALDELAATGGTADVARLLDILLRPVVELATSRLPQRHPFVRLMSRNLVEPPAFMADLVARELGPVIQRVVPLFRQQLPQLDLTTLQFRVRFVMGATTMTYAAVPFAPFGSNDPIQALDPRAQLQHLLVAAQAVLQAPLPPPPPQGSLAPSST